MNMLFVTGEPVNDPSVRYRCFHHQEQLKLAGIESEVAWIGDESIQLDQDIIFLHRVEYDDFTADIVERARSLGKILVYETDDLVFEPDLARHQGYKFALEEHPIRRVLERASRYLKAFELCDCCVTATNFIAQMAKRRGKEAYVVRNAFSLEELEIAEQVYRQPVGAGGRIVLGYMSGTPSHDWDFAEIKDALIEVMSKHKHVYLQITGKLNLSPAFQRFEHRVRRIPPVPWREIYGITGSLDINLAPLEIREPFCQAKSEIKYVEAALVGVPTIASATEAFKFAITPEENGLLASNTQEWIEGLERLISDPHLIEVMGENARRHVLANYRPEVRSPQLVAVLNEIVQKYGKRHSATIAEGRPSQPDHLVYRKDFGIPYWQRPPLFPPSRQAIKFCIRISRRILKYEGIWGLCKRVLSFPIRRLRRKIAKLIALK